MRREVYREIRERQGHTCPIYPKINNNQMQYAQSPLGKYIIIDHAKIHP